MRGASQELLHTHGLCDYTCWADYSYISSCPLKLPYLYLLNSTVQLTCDWTLQLIDLSRSLSTPRSQTLMLVMLCFLSMRLKMPAITLLGPIS